MKRAHLATSIISLLAAGVAVGVLAAGLAGPASAHPASAHPASAHPASAHPASAHPVLAAAAAAPATGTAVRTVVLDCPGIPALVRPKTYILSCADGYIQLDKLAWTSWTPGLASASGTLVKNTCMPSCVAGHFHSYPVLVILWGKAAVKNHPGEQTYTRMTLIYPGARPQGVPQTQTISLPTSLPGLAAA